MSTDLTVNKDTKYLDNQDQELDDQSTEYETVTFDDLLSSAGEFGLYQVFLFLSTIPFFMFGVYVYFSQIFITEAPRNHWCWIPELENLTMAERRDLAIPKDNSIFGYSRCTSYVANWIEVLETGLLLPDVSWDTVSCQHGWEFDTTEIPYPTIATEQEWVCDRGSYQATAQSLFSVGSILGGLIIGWTADKYGRIPAVVMSTLFGCIGGISSTFAKNFAQFAVCRFIMGMAFDNCMTMVYLVVLEYVAPKYRSLIANLSFAIFFSLFSTTLPFISLALGHWQLICLYTSLPLALGVLTPLIVPESAMWLLSKGRTEKAIKKALIIARTNKKEIPPKLIDQFRATVAREIKEENVTLIDVFKNPILRKVLICTCLEYMFCTIVFDGLIRSVGQLDFNFFLSFAAVSSTELPSIVLVAFILDYVGRRWLTFTVMTISAVFAVLSAFVGSGFVPVIFAVIARFAVNMSFSTALQWTAEVFPTGVRGSGMALVHICGYVANVVTPYIVYLNTYIDWLPQVIIAMAAAGGAIVALFLPETAMKKIPQTFEEAENLALSQKFWEVPCLEKRNSSEGVEQIYPNE